MSIIWSDKEKEIVYKLLEEDRVYREISQALAKYGFPLRSPNAIRKMLARDSYEKESLISTNEKTDSYGSDTWDALQDMREKAIDIVDWESIVGCPVHADTKIVSISDLHIPFHHTSLIQEFIEKEAEDTDILVLNGDFLEHYSVSSWPKNKTVILKYEYELGLRILQELSAVFPKIVLTKGNHEERLQRYFASNIDPSVSFLVDPDMLHRLSNGYDFDEKGYLEKRYDFDNIHYTRGPLSWFVKIGKTIFAHPSGGSGIPMRTAENTAKYFLNRGEDFECLVVAHTHQQGQLIWNNKLLIEQGCACIPLEYEATSRMKYRPQSFGYAKIYMDDDGHVDFDRSRPVYYGTGAIVEHGNNIPTIGK